MNKENKDLRDHPEVRKRRNTLKLRKRVRSRIKQEMPRFIEEEEMKLLRQEDSYEELDKRFWEVDIRLEDVTHNFNSNDDSFVKHEVTFGKRLFYWLILGKRNTQLEKVQVRFRIWSFRDLGNKLGYFMWLIFRLS